MRTQKIEEKQRISKGTGRTMIAVAILLDLLPFILIFIALGIVLYSFGSGAGADIIDAYDQKGFDAWYYKGKLAGRAVLGLTGSAVTGIVLGPIIYTVGSFLSVFFGYLLFTVWFLFKGVNMWSFRSIQRVIVNVTAGLIEMIPLVNLLPGISLMVWRHVKLSQMEDRAKNIENAHNIGKQLARASTH